jgi:DNA repair protein RadB
MQLPTKYSTGCKSIDELLGGGFESGTVTQLYGEAASGKTNICLQVAIKCAREGKAIIFIDSEGFSPERFLQIARSSTSEDVESIARRIIIYEPRSFEQQTSCINELETVIKEEAGKSGVALVILDSATLFYRLELDEERSVHLKGLANQIANLLELARKYDLAVVITNQVYMDIEKGELLPVAKFTLEYLSKVIVQLGKVEGVGGKRRATLKKHRSMPEDTSCTFFITSKGVEDGPGGTTKL